MIRAASLEPRLRELLEQGSLPASTCSRALLSAVAALISAGALEWSRSGAGRALVVRQPAVLREFIQRQFPSATGPEPGGSGSSRVEGVARYRDSKSLPSDLPSTVELRAVTPGARFLCDGAPVAASELTQRHGLFAFLLENGGARYGIPGGRVGIVENPAVFLRFESLATGIPLVLHARGRLPDRVIAWLASDGCRNADVVHFPDYDPVGLSEFLRLWERLGDRVTLFAPADLEPRFERFAQPSLLANEPARRLLQQLRSSTHPGVRRVVELVDRYNAGLEQESLLVSFD